MTIPNDLFSHYLIQYRILRFQFFSIYKSVFLSSLEILADRLITSISAALILLQTSNKHGAEIIYLYDSVHNILSSSLLSKNIEI